MNPITPVFEKNNKIFWQNKNNCETLLTFIKEK